MLTAMLYEVYTSSCAVLATVTVFFLAKEDLYSCLQRSMNALRQTELMCSMCIRLLALVISDAL